jgi:orotidine-5'-phosphate decarboxylase
MTGKEQEMNAKSKLWIALDTDKARSLEIVHKIGPARLPVVKGVKLNRSLDQEVFRPDGDPQLLEEIAKYGVSAWADLKLHDIPRTVVGRMEPYVRSGLVQYITVMAKGEVDMMVAAVEAAGSGVNVIAVTELTSLSEEQVHLGSGHPAKASVINLARSAVLAGVKYLVCSGQELLVIRGRRELILKPFVPGVKPAFASAGKDQSRTMTIVDALRMGADAVVVGGAIVDAADPVEVIKRIAQEIEEAAEK